MSLDDATLTETGLSLRSADPGRVLLIACGALAREILAIRDLNGWGHVDLACLPAKLHNDPDKIPEAVRARVRQARAEGVQTVFVVYADCGTGGLLDKVCEEEGVERIAGPHCYSFFEGNVAFAAHADEITAFYLTDFLARQFDTLIWKGFGLDRHPDMPAMIFAHYEKVVYLAQTQNAELDRAAERAAQADAAAARDGAIAAGFAFIAALAALVLMFKLLRSVSFTPYVIYRIGLGVVLLGIAYS